MGDELNSDSYTPGSMAESMSPGTSLSLFENTGSPVALAGYLSAQAGREAWSNVTPESPDSRNNDAVAKFAAQLGETNLGDLSSWSPKGFNRAELRVVGLALASVEDELAESERAGHQTLDLLVGALDYAEEEAVEAGR